MLVRALASAPGLCDLRTTVADAALTVVMCLACGMQRRDASEHDRRR